MFNALREAIDEEMGRDDTVFVLGEDVGHYGGSYKVTKDLYKSTATCESSIPPSPKTALPAWRWERP
jgi:hypothetical protein